MQYSAKDPHKNNAKDQRKSNAKDPHKNNAKDPRKNNAKDLRGTCKRFARSAQYSRKDYANDQREHAKDPQDPHAHPYLSPPKLL